MVARNDKIKVMAQSVSRNDKFTEEKFKMKKLSIIFIALCFIVSFVEADMFENQEIPTGIRPMSMGETFVGIADDSTAIRWNPAGLALMKHSELHGELSPMFGDFAPISGSGLYNTYVSLATPFQKINTIAIDWLYLGFQEEPEFIYDGVPELGYGEHMIYAGFARKLWENIYAGLSLKYYNVNVSLDGETWAKGQGIGADIGGLWKVVPRFTLGLSLKNVLPLKVYYETGSANTMLELAPTLGAGYRPIKNLTVGLDINDSVHLGAEYWLFNILAIRAGTIKGLRYDNQDNFIINSGVGVRYKFAQLDYCLSHNPDFTLSHKFGTTFAWGYHAYLVDVVSVNTKDMFASLYKSYTDEDVVRIMVKNKTQKPLDIEIGIYISGLMDSPTSKKLTLAPGTPTEVNLPIVFSDDVMRVTDDVTRNAEIIVSYEHEERKSEDSTPGKFVLYNRNAFVWDDLDKIAGFVTPQDSKIKEFSRGVLQSVTAGKIRDRFISDNFYKAMLIFDALGSYGMIYISDPNRPFALTSEAENAIDYVQYPVESLKEKSGDCDDCVVLYASCLENVGIGTILVDVPEHIFMMFDSGLTPAEASMKLLSDDMYVEIGGRIWIPVETTMFGQGFMPAWIEASESLKKWAAEQAGDEEEIMRLTFVQNAWKEYPSASIPKLKFGIAVPHGKLQKMLKDDVDKVLDRKDTDYSKLLDEYKKNSKDSKLNNKIGIYYAKNGLYTYADDYFNNAIKYDTKNSSAYNNSGNLYLMLGEYDKAIDQYKNALKIDPANTKTAKNLRRAKQEKAKSR